MKIFKKIKTFFSKKEKDKKNLFLTKDPKSSLVKKRKHLKVNFDFLRHLEFFKRKYIPYFLIFSIIFAIIVAILIFGPFFRVKYIEIIKKDDITNMDIAYKAVDFFRGKQLFDINEIEVFNRLKNYEDNIQSVAISLSLPNTLKIEISSYKGIFNVIINEKNYILTENGTIIPQNHSKNLRILNIMKEIDKNKFIEYKQIFYPQYVEKINTIIKKFEQNFINVPIENLYYYDMERELHIEISNSRLLIFSLDDNTNIDSQIERLAIFNKEYFKIENGEFVYMDLRINNKIFYCPTAEKIRCENNIKGIYGEYKKEILID